MAKAILEFDLDNPDDRMAHFRAVKSTDMANVLFELTHNLKRDCVSDVEDEPKLTKQGAVELVFKRMYELLESHNIQIDELII